MQLRGNWLSLVSWRAFSTAGNQVERSIGRLSSGKRINTAGDDAAGLGISERIQGQFRGLLQANRNALDGVSLIQTAESALNQTEGILQRGRELSVQAANGTLSDDQKSYLQTELTHLLSEVNGIADSTTYNGKHLLTGSGQSGQISRTLAGLRTGWLEEPEKLIATLFGLTGDGTTLTVAFQDQGSSAAWVTGDPNPVTGHLDALTLNINLSDFAADVSPLYNDRKVGRAVAQAILSRNSDYNQLPAWFLSGVADYLVGGDEELKANLLAAGGNAQQVVNAMNDALTGTWQDDSIHRSAAYLAVKYFDKGLLPGLTMKDAMDYLKSNTLNDTFNWAYGSASLSDFVTSFLSTTGGGATFLSTQLNLNDADVGAIGGGDAATVIPDARPYTLEPMTGFKIEWPAVASPESITLQVGANAEDKLTFSIPEVTAYTLNLLGIDLVHAAQDAIQRLGAAIGKVSGVRSELGAINNRLEHTVGSNANAAEAGQGSYSRIVDLDMALEVSNLTRQQIMLSSAGAMLAQANTARQNVNWLLKGMGERSPSAVWAT
jgi:flagellin